MFITPRELSTLVSRFVVVACLGGITACFDRRFDADTIGDGTSRPVELFAADAAAPPACGGVDPSPLSALQIHVRTTAVGGTFAPRNVGAVWIEDAAGAFVKTVARWGTIRAKWLLRFNAASHGNVTDAITGATLVAHQTHDVTWNLTDLTHCEVATGDYQVVLELTDRDAAGASLALPFHKDQAPLTISPNESPNFHDLKLTLQ